MKAPFYAPGARWQAVAARGLRDRRIAAMSGPMRLPALFLALAAAAPLPADADSAGIAEALAADPAIPGAVVGWVTEDGSALAVAGVRRAGEAAEVAEGDLWHIGSLTKSMTATLAARMVEAGRIGWDTTAGELLGTAHPDMNASWLDVPLEAFLRHASGMRANLSLYGTLRVGQGPREDYVARALASTPEGARGGYLYSNAGYVVAGAMLEAAGGAPWEDLVAREVFAPLGLSSAGFGPPQGDQPQGHRGALFVGLRPVPPGPRADNIPALGPAGRVHLSAADMLRYLRAHLLAEPGFLSEESWARLHRAEGPGDYAMGWVEADGVLRHSGSNTMWFAQMRLYPEDGVAVFVAVNSGMIERVRPAVEAAADAAFSAAGG
jgi:D-alanyl-D-alanine carboxypeptidase